MSAGDLKRSSCRLRWLTSLGLAGRPLVVGRQVHGCRVAVVRESKAGVFAGTDGFVTNRPGVVLGVFSADCQPVWLVDPRRRAVGLAHAGRLGVVRGIVPAAIRLMRRKFGSRPRDLLVWIGPHIRRSCYPIALARLTRAQCVKAGVPAGRIRASHVCTGCDRRFFSHRRHRDPRRMLSIAAICYSRNA